MIREALPDDASQVAEIYNHYVLHTVVTFETEAVTEEQMTAHITETKTSYPWLVFEENGNILGYAYATRWKTRQRMILRSKVPFMWHRTKPARG